MFLRVEVFGHYPELGKTAEPDAVETAPDNVPQPMQIYTEPLGFRILSDDGEIATDV